MTYRADYLVYRQTPIVIVLKAAPAHGAYCGAQYLQIEYNLIVVFIFFVFCEIFSI